MLLITIVLNGLFSFLFGFVGTLELAMAIRFLAGLSNGETLLVSDSQRKKTRVRWPWQRLLHWDFYSALKCDNVKLCIMVVL